MGASPGAVVIAGAGLAGSRTAETLRAEGFAGRIVLVGDEPFPAYERPALSKAYLAGTANRARLPLRPPGYLEERGIELLTGRWVCAVDLGRRRVTLDDGSHVGWDAFVLATGARARRFPGAQPPGVHTLRTLADADVLRAELVPGRRLVIVGAGLVGAEVATTAAGLGVAVVLVDEQAPLARVAGPEVAQLLARRFRAAGVRLCPGRAAGFRADGRGALRAVRLEDGREIACDAALVAIGAEPAAELLPALRAPDGGIAVDTGGRSAHPGVFAAGDVASVWQPRLSRFLRLEHWTTAAAQGAAVARRILGLAAPEDGPPYFWTDQAGLRLQLVGSRPPGARVRIDGDESSFRAEYLAPDGHLAAVLLANRPGEVAEARRELAGGRKLAA